MFFDFLSLSKVQPIKTSIVVSASLCASSATLLLLLSWPLKHHSQGVLVVLLFLSLFWKTAFRWISTCHNFLKVLQLDFPLGIGLFFSQPPQAYWKRGQGGLHCYLILFELYSLNLSIQRQNCPKEAPDRNLCTDLHSCRPIRWSRLPQRRILWSGKPVW